MIRDELLKYVDSEYKEFTKKLNPGREDILGIRVPQMRELAKKYAKLNWRDFLSEQDFYFEEVMIHGMILGYAKLDVDEFFERFADFIPLIDTWSLCDSVIMGCKLFQKEKEKSWQFIQPYLKSLKEFEVRVGLCILMTHLMPSDEKGNKISRKRSITMDSLDNQEETEGVFLKRTLMVLDHSFDQGYYAHMCAAWLLADIFCFFPAHTMKFIKENNMDDATFNKGIQKIRESRIPSAEVKAYLDTFKRK